MRGGAGAAAARLCTARAARPGCRIMQTLAAKYDVIAPEHPGFGDSDTPDWLDTIHDLAYFYLDLLEQLDLDGVHLVGISLGGWIAAELAVRNTSRLASLTLVGAAGLHVNGRQADRPVPAHRRAAHPRLLLRSGRADEMIARVLRPSTRISALKNRTTAAKLPGSRAATIRICTNGCTASTCRRCWSGATMTGCSRRNMRTPIEAHSGLEARDRSGMRAPAAGREAGGVRRRARRLHRRRKRLAQHEVLQFPSDALSARRSRRHRPQRLRLGDALQQRTTIPRRAPSSITTISTRWSLPTSSASTASASTSITRPPTA